MKKLTILSLAAVFLLAGCATKTQMAAKVYIPYSNDAQGYFVPYPDSWHMKEYTFPQVLPVAMTGFDPAPLTHTKAGVGGGGENGDGLITITSYWATNLPSKVDQTKAFERDVATTEEQRVIASGQTGTLFTRRQKDGMVHVFIVEGDDIAHVIESGALTEEQVTIFNKMIEGFSIN